MKKIREAYHAGLEGKDAPEKGRLQRVAHSVGRRSLSRMVEENEKLDADQAQIFATAEKHAKGANQQAMRALRAAAEIPHQVSNHPLWGIGRTASDGTRSLEWMTSLSAGRDRDSSRPNKSPLVESLGALKFDSPHWSHNGFTIPVDNLTIMCSATTEGDQVGPVTTKIHINTRTYDADNVFIDEEYQFTGGLTVTLDEDGAITELGMTNSSHTGYHDEDPADVHANLVEFFEGVQAAANQTAQLYRQLGDSL